MKRIFTTRSASRRGRRTSRRGMALFTVAFGMVGLVSVIGLSVDLVYLYAARSEAQRAADAAAVAGAQVFANSGYTSGLLSNIQVEPIAAADAAGIGNANKVGGQSPNINPNNFSAACPTPTGSDGCFDLSNSSDPQITVVVQRTVAHGNPLPLFFMKLIGVATADVSATATAEAYNPSVGGGPPINLQSIKPWLVPNCDPGHSVPVGDSRGNPNCPVSGGLSEYYVYPPGTPQESQILNPGPLPSGVVGEQIALKPGSPSQAPAPSQFYPLYLAQNNGTRCPACAGSITSSNGGGSASLYQQNIECWIPSIYTCGTQNVALASGNMVGPTSAGVDCLIHETSGSGQDTINLTTTPFQMIAGTANPYVTPGTVITSSDSVVAVPLYDGANLCPGGSCPASTNVQIEGFLQVFLVQEGPPQGTVTSAVLNVAGCGNGKVSSGLSSTNSFPIAVRLIHD